MVKTRTGRAGGRSGVVIQDLDDSNVDGWFDSARSPESNAKRDGDDDWNPKRAAAAATPSKKKTVKTPKQNVRLSLGGTGGEIEEQGSLSVSAKRYAAKVRRKNQSSDLASPDLSRVSTAAMSPRSEERTDTEDEEGKDRGGEDDIENALLTQENDNPENEEIDVIAKQSARRSSTSNLEVASPPNEFPAPDDDGEEEDDLGPPALPDDMTNEDDDDQSPEEAPETKKGGENDIGGLESDEEQNNHLGDNADYDDHDDDEGPGFNMVHDPETPLTVREERKKKELEKIREERKRRRREQNPDYESEDENEDDNNQTPKDDKGKNSKKKKGKRVAFSPKGIQAGNRDYTLEPIGNFVEESPDELGVRRSRRARVKPLEFWRGEKMEYGAQNEPGQLGQVMGDMPVVKAVRKAMETPYKKLKPRKDTAKTKTGSKKDSAGANRSAEEEEFNSKKLRQKYKFLNGEEAYLWDEDNGDTGDQKVVAYHSKLEEEYTELRVKNKFIGKHYLGFKFEHDNNSIFPGHQAGTLVIPPKLVKDPEANASTTIIFTVIRCQPKALEVAYPDPDETKFNHKTAQRFLLGPGDMFQVPPGNSYRLENHSKNADAVMSYTMIYPKEFGEEE